MADLKDLVVGGLMFGVLFLMFEGHKGIQQDLEDSKPSPVQKCYQKAGEYLGREICENGCLRDWYLRTSEVKYDKCR
jgi:hypothetical protein